MKPNGAGWLCVVASLWTAPAVAFNSGSSGSDGVFAPTVSTEVVLSPNGVLNYVSVNVPAGVKVTFKRNAINTPVTMLVQGDATIAGTIDVSGSDSPQTGDASPDPNPLDDGLPGRGGPGGFDGGAGGVPSQSVVGGDGLGPGGGRGGRQSNNFNDTLGVGGAHATNAASGAQKTYGNEFLAPLIGGSGGGGGAATNRRAAGGGGGGGAIMIAVSGALRIDSTGRILANGGRSLLPLWAPGSGAAFGGFGGPGSGGAIRLVATSLSQLGELRAVDGNASGTAGLGWIRIEAESLGSARTTTPTFFSGLPRPVFVTGSPSLSITHIGGVVVPEFPTGSGDVNISGTVPNPVSVSVRTTNIPAGAVVRITMTPSLGLARSVDALPTTGDIGSANTSASIEIPPGPSVLSASTTFAITAALADMLAPYAQGERFEKIRLTSALGGVPSVVGIASSGQEFKVPLALFARSSSK